MINSSYLTQGFDLEQRKTAIKLAKKHLSKVLQEFDVIVCTGVSGLLMGPSIADAINKPFCVVRKDSDSTHSWMKVEGYIKDNAKYIIVDDFMESGTTIFNIKEAINKEYKNCIFCGAWFYRSSKRKDSIEDVSLGNYVLIGTNSRKYFCDKNIMERLVRIREQK